MSWRRQARREHIIVFPWLLLARTPVTLSCEVGLLMVDTVPATVPEM